jgi:hypothetical protein
VRYWIDTEFIEDGKTIDLLSIGIVAADGRVLCMENAEADRSKASDWVKENVLPHLTQDIGDWPSRADIAQCIRDFCDPEKHGKPEFWGYYADYDWVVLCQLFGTMMDLPKGWPMYCRDIKQWCDQKGNPQLPEQGKGEHHALANAQWNRQAWQFLRTYKPVCPCGDEGCEH